MKHDSDIYEQRFRALFEADMKRYDEEVRRKKAQYDRTKAVSAARSKKQLEVLKSIGIKTDFIDLDRKTAVKETKEFLAEALPPMASRASVRAQDTKDGAVHGAAASAAGRLVVPVYAANLLAQDLGNINLTDGEIGSGWVFPNDPSNIKIKAGGPGVDVWCFEAVGGPADPKCNIVFTFTPNKTTTYEMTAIVAFHGYYVLVSDDGIFTCKTAHVELDVEMSVNQYYNLGPKSFPAALDITESNVSEVVPYDFTKFYDYTAVLKEGDPVVVTLTCTLKALGIGSGTYAELNFATGNANYIQPLFLSVLQQ